MDARLREETNDSSVDGLDKSPEIIIPPLHTHTRVWLAPVAETMLLSAFPAAHAPIGFVLCSLLGRCV